MHAPLHPQVSSSALGAASSYWADAFAGASEAQRAAVLEGLRRSRPVLVQGYESMVMARQLLEEPDSWAAILASWTTLLPEALARWGEDEAALIAHFEQHRRQRMQGLGPAAWAALNRPYAGVQAALQSCESPFYIASSKAAHRVAALMGSHFGLELGADSPRLFCSLLPPNEKKVQALREIMGRPVCEDPATRLHFIDDR
jgi:hypothetical protein